jgi:hypothetical protein
MVRSTAKPRGSKAASARAWTDFTELMLMFDVDVWCWCWYRAKAGWRVNRRGGWRGGKGANLRSTPQKSKEYTFLTIIRKFQPWRWFPAPSIPFPVSAHFRVCYCQRQVPTRLTFVVSSAYITYWIIWSLQTRICCKVISIALKYYLILNQLHHVWLP